MSTTTMGTNEKVDTQSFVTSIVPPNASAEVVDDNPSAANAATTFATSPSITVAQVVREQNLSINEILGQNDKIDEHLEQVVEMIAHSEASAAEEDTTLGLSGTTNVPTESLLVEREDEEVLSATMKTTIYKTVVVPPSSHGQQFRPRPEYRPSEVIEASTTGGQLYQDAAAKDQQEQPVLKLRGV